MTDLNLSAPLMNDAMIKRDNYFHSCWMELKYQRPDLFELVNQIELKIAGYESEPIEDNDDDSDVEIL